MSRPAVLTRRARADLRDALLWIGADNLTAARGLNDAVREAAVRIGKNPRLGRHRPTFADNRYRFWSVVHYGYLIVYTDQTDPPRIIRVVHTARDLPRVLSELYG